MEIPQSENDSTPRPRCLFSVLDPAAAQASCAVTNNCINIQLRRWTWPS